MATVERPIAWAVSHWWDEPWSRGAWSLLRVGASADTRRQLGTPVDDRLIIAGEATHPDQAGMTHAAYSEGQRAARWCIDQGHRSVTVIGAGAAGLGAARYLIDHLIDVRVVEARDRIGGRIRTVTLDGPALPDGDSTTAVRVELGANWLQQGPRNDFVPLAESLGLRLVDTDFHEPVDLSTTGAVDTSDDDAILAEFRRRSADPNQPDRSVHAVLDEWLRDPSPFTAGAISRLIDCEVFLDAGAPLDTVSARFGFEPGVGADDRWIVGGYGQLLDHLAASLPIELDWPVDTVRRTAHNTTVTGPRGSVEADAVIVTVPAAVIAHGSVRFDPPLPDHHLAALGLLTVGRVEKVALQFERRWWPPTTSGYLRITGERSAGIDGCLGGDVSEWLDLTDEVGAAVIVGLFTGEWVASMWQGRTDAQIARAAAGVLRAG